MDVYILKKDNSCNCNNVQLGQKETHQIDYAAIECCCYFRWRSHRRSLRFQIDREADMGTALNEFDLCAGFSF